MKWYKPSEKLPEEGKPVLVTSYYGDGYNENFVIVATLWVSYYCGKEWVDTIELRTSKVRESDRWAYIELPEE